MPCHCGVRGFVIRAESGKSVCDRYGGLQKMAAQRAVKAGRNITSGRELADAVTTNGGIANLITVLASKMETYCSAMLLNKIFFRPHSYSECE